MKPIIIGIVVALSVLIAGSLFFSPASVPMPTQEEGGVELYANGTYGISFAYPEGYLVSEREVSPGHYAITLIRQEDAVPVVNGEGPTAVSIEIYEDEASLADWLASPVSNLSLGDETYSSTTAAGQDAVHYGWSGLYEGETVAFIHEGDVVAVSVTYISPSDPIREVYNQVLSSLTLR